MFKKYMHIERYGNTEVEGINLGKCLIFPKIDGTNGSVWWNKEEDKLQAGSRNRLLSEEKDNANFYKSMLADEGIVNLCKLHPDYIFYGEWLCPHSLKTYRDNAWRKFYIFDVYNRVTEKYINYDDYSDILINLNIEFIRPITARINPSIIKLQEDVQNNTYLIKEDSGVGEGIVIKNYDFVNRHGRTTWAKIVTNEFKDKHRNEMGVSLRESGMVEQKIVDTYVTQHLVDKVYSKIAIEGWSSKMISRLLDTVFYDLVNEETYSIVKKFKLPTINFGDLKGLTINKVKELRKDIF